MTKKKLFEADGIECSRLHYLFATGFPDDVFEVIREEAKICSYIEIPLQHIASTVLKSMRRSGTKEKPISHRI